jgi:hypothetical protein
MAMQLQHDIEKDEAEFEFMPRDDIYAVASLFKVSKREILSLSR